MTDLLLSVEQREILRNWAINHVRRGKVRPPTVSTSAMRFILQGRKASIPLKTLKALIDAWGDSSILELLRWPSTQEELRLRNFERVQA